MAASGQDYSRRGPDRHRYHGAPMIRLALALADLPLPAARTADLPRLPSLERLLARGARRPADGDFRGFALARAGIESAALSLAAEVAGRPGHWALVTPLHLLAGLERVHLHPAGPVELPRAEFEALAATCREHLAGDGFELELVAPALALLRLPRPVTAVTHDPLPLGGREAGAWLPSGPDGAWLRRLFTELQMLLHGHPVNAARTARGELAVNALWPWGLGAEPRPPASRPLPALASDDPVLRAAWVRRGGEPLAAPRDLGRWLREGPGGERVATLALATLSRSPGEALVLAERHWFAPLCAALADGTLRSVALQLGGVELALARRDRLRWWRRLRPWHEALA